MSVRYDELLPALKRLLPQARIDLVGRSVAFIRRLRQVSASDFVWAVVLSRFGSSRPGFEQARQWYARLTDTLLWPRPFQIRFKSAATVRLFEQALEEAVAPWRSRSAARHPLAKLFPDIIAWDSTVVQVADELRPFFKGTRTAVASLKVLLGVSIWGLLPIAARVVSGNRHDMILGPDPALFRQGTLVLFDKGFASYERLRQLDAASLFYLCPMRLNGIAKIVGVNQAPSRVKRALQQKPGGVALRELLSTDKKIRTTWDLRVLVWPTIPGIERRPVPIRLVIVPGPNGEQRPYMTNLATTWKPHALRELYRLRWQVELVFKELKQHLSLESVPTKDPHAAQVFLLASLLALALSRTVATWLTPLRTLAGLASALRPAVLTRALRAHVRTLGRALRESGRTAVFLLQILADDLLAEARQLQRQREDSFRRLSPMISSLSA